MNQQQNMMVPVPQTGIMTQTLDANAAAAAAQLQGGSLDRFTGGFSSGSSYKVDANGSFLQFFAPDGRVMQPMEATNGAITEPYVTKLPIIILDASPEVERQYYRDQFVRGTGGKAPDCFSVDGLTPDPTVPMASRPTAHNPTTGQVEYVSACNACPMNVKSGTAPRPCKFHKDISFVLACNPSGPVWTMKIPSMSLFGDGNTDIDGTRLRSFSELAAAIKDETAKNPNIKEMFQLIVGIHAIAKPDVSKMVNFSVVGFTDSNWWPYLTARKKDSDNAGLIRKIGQAPNPAPALSQQPQQPMMGQQPQQPMMGQQPQQPMMGQQPQPMMTPAPAAVQQSVGNMAGVQPTAGQVITSDPQAVKQALNNALGSVPNFNQ